MINIEKLIRENEILLSKNDILRREVNKLNDIISSNGINERIIVPKSIITKIGWIALLDLLHLNGFFNNYYELHFTDEIHFIKER